MNDVLRYGLFVVAAIGIWAIPLLIWHGFWWLVRKFLGA